MFLLVYGHHVGAHPHGHQHGLRERRNISLHASEPRVNIALVSYLARMHILFLLQILGKLPKKCTKNNEIIKSF